MHRTKLCLGGSREDGRKAPPKEYRQEVPEGLYVTTNARWFFRPLDTILRSGGAARSPLSYQSGNLLRLKIRFIIKYFPNVTVSLLIPYRLGHDDRTVLVKLPQSNVIRGAPFQEVRRNLHCYFLHLQKLYFGQNRKQQQVCPKCLINFLHIYNSPVPPINDRPTENDTPKQWTKIIVIYTGRRTGVLTCHNTDVNEILINYNVKGITIFVQSSLLTYIFGVDQ